jgi:hypothetical protein
MVEKNAKVIIIISLMEIGGIEKLLVKNCRSVFFL